MLGKQPRLLAHIITAVALTLLLPLIFVHLDSTKSRIERVQQATIAAITRDRIVDNLSSAALMIGEKRIPPHPIKEVAILEAKQFPENIIAMKYYPNRNDCGEIIRYGDVPVGLSCVTLVAGPELSGDKITEILSQLRALKVPQALMLLYGNDNEASSYQKFPDILFAHAVVETRYGPVLAVYPAVHLDNSYRIENRPWFEHEENAGKISLSPLYHDYATKLLTVTISKHATDQVRIGVDLYLSASAPSLSVYFLNLLFAVGAALVYWRYHWASKQRFVFYLLSSTLVLSFCYLVLTLNLLFKSDYQPLVADRTLLAFVLPFLPSGAFLILAGRTIRHRLKDEWREFSFWWALEAAFALIGVLTGTALCSSVFGFISLCIFGYFVFDSRRNYSDPILEDVSPHPKYMCIYVSLAYIFWGITQFVLVLFSSEAPPVWRFISQLKPLGILRELLIDESGAFIILMYAKSVAVLVTIIYLGAIEGARYKLRLASLEERSPYIQIDSGGLIVGEGHLPGGFSKLKGMPFANLVLDPEDRAEVWHAINNGLELTAFICSLGKDFQENLFRVSIERETHNKTRLVTLKLVDRNMFRQVLDWDICKEISFFVEDASKHIESAVSEIDPDTLRFHLKNIIERGAFLSSKAKSELQVMSEGAALDSPKVNFLDAWNILYEKFLTTSKSHLIIKLEATVGDLASIPKKLRISEEVWALIVDSLISEFRHAFGEKEVVCKIRAFTEEGPLGYEGLVLFSISITPGSTILSRYHSMIDEEVFDLEFSGKPHESRNFSLIKFLLDTFNGKLKAERHSSDTVELVLGIRSLGSSLGRLA